jgi:ABC-2 type transport system ATP-binding protein
MYAIETFNLSKQFKKALTLRELFTSPLMERKLTTAVKGVSIKVKKGELLGLLGPNGAGKTTLIKLLCTLILPTEGGAVVNGYNIVKEEQQVRENIGLVTGEERSFYWRLTGRQNLEFFASLCGLSGQRAQKKINNIFNLIELQGKEDICVQEYSAGMKQKLAIGRALLNEPSVLFLDEPTKSLDPLASQNMRRFIHKNLVKEQGKTVILTTQRMEEVEALCERIIIIHNGEVKFFGRVADLKAEKTSLEAAFIEIISKKGDTS